MTNKKFTRIGNCVELALTMMETGGQDLPELIFNSKKDSQVELDEAPVTQMLMSLFLTLIDLIEHRGKGVLLITLDEVHIEEGFVPKMKEGMYSHLVIVGHGAGLSSQKQKDVIEPFLEVDSDNVIAKLRLDRSSALVREQGGWMTATNVPDCGTAIHLYFESQTED